MTAPKIVTLDIETSPIVAYVWGLFKQFVGLNQIIEDWSILSFCAKYLGSDKVLYYDVSKQRNLRDDARLMRKLHRILDDADIVVVQNGKKFDLRKINARFLTHGMLPPSPYKVVDTMLEARKVAAMTSNKLEWLAKVLTDSEKDKHTEFPGFDLWAECMKRNPRAWQAMRDYNPQDVIATEEVYLKLRPYIEGHPNVAVFDDSEVIRCPACGSHEVDKRGFSYTQTGKYQRYQCSGCGKWSRSRYTLNTKGKRHSLLSN